jgi:hypothetical protein
MIDSSLKRSCDRCGTSSSQRSPDHDETIAPPRTEPSAANCDRQREALGKYVAVVNVNVNLDRLRPGP